MAQVIAWALIWAFLIAVGLLGYLAARRTADALAVERDRLTQWRAALTADRAALAGEWAAIERERVEIAESWIDLQTRIDELEREEAELETAWILLRKFRSENSPERDQTKNPPPATTERRTRWDSLEI